MTDTRGALLISDRIDPAHPAIAAYAYKYDIWHMVRQRDAMAYIRARLPELVMLDLDMAGLEIAQLMQVLKRDVENEQVMLFGLSRNAMAVPEGMLRNFDRIIGIPY